MDSCFPPARDRDGTIIRQGHDTIREVVTIAVTGQKPTKNAGSPLGVAANEDSASAQLQLGAWSPGALKALYSTPGGLEEKISAVTEALQETFRAQAAALNAPRYSLRETAAMLERMDDK